jgi:uncharacterized protein (UPF0218 family)
MAELKKMIDTEKPTMVIAVGDCVSQNMATHEIFPHIYVVDHQVMRKPIEPIPLNAEQTLHVKNPPQMLADEVWTVMEKAIASPKRTEILVDGEEDLITMVAVLCAPLNSFIVYGQPNEGVVVVKVTEERKKGIQGVVDRMERVS